MLLLILPLVTIFIRLDYTYPLGVASRKSFSIRTAKAVLYFDSIAHLIGVMLAVATNNANLFKSIRKLMAA
jgi:hypothetical protein